MWEESPGIVNMKMPVHYIMPKTIVLIDDDPDDLDILKEAFQKVEPGTQCISFVYPDEAVKVITNDLIVVPDMIIIDLNMPRKTGLDCLRELRSVEEFKDTPIIMYSTTISQASRDLLFKTGATHVFQKPSRYDAWSGIMKMILSQNWNF